MKVKQKNKELNYCTVDDRKWKEGNKQYLNELQRCFDIVDNIEDSKLKARVISQMLICDKVLTELAEDMFKNVYVEGYKKAKQE